jgi:hypothetical protein
VFIRERASMLAAGAPATGQYEAALDDDAAHNNNNNNTNTAVNTTTTTNNNNNNNNDDVNVSVRITHIVQTYFMLMNVVDRSTNIGWLLASLGQRANLLQMRSATRRHSRLVSTIILSLSLSPSLPLLQH